MDGLECSEINYKKINIDNEKFRFDSEFFQKKYIKSYNLVKTKSNVKIGEICDTFTDFHANGSYEVIANNFQLLDYKDYAYMVRTTDLEKENYLDNVKYITKESYEFLSKSKIYGGELLINKIGSPGSVFLMPYLGQPVSLGMNLFLLRIKDNKNINETLLYLFFKTSIGKNIISRKVNGTVPLTIDKEAIKSLYVPIFSNKFISVINGLIEIRNKKSKEAKAQYDKAKNIIDSVFQIQASTLNNNVKQLSNSLLSIGRLDAEYYQPKYDDLFTALSKFYCKKLSGENGITEIKKSIEPGSEYYQDYGIPFVRVSDIDKFGITKPEIKIPNNIVKDIETFYPKKDTILLSKDGSVGLAYKVEEDLSVVTSGALLHLTIKNPNEILPDYLTLVLNSPIVQLQAERDCNGAIIQHWKPSEIENVTIPILGLDIQQEIAEKVQESFRLREQSKRLLDNAVKAVEMAIETDEESALLWLELQN